MRGLDECIAFFRNDGGFSRLFDGMFDIYLRYERCFGAVRLVNPSHDEERAISEFFKRDYYNQALIRIGLAEFERQIQRVFSPELVLSTVLETYLDRPLRAHKSDMKASASPFSIYVEQSLSPRYIGTDAELWLKDITQNMRRSYREWAVEYADNPAETASVIEGICEALNSLPFFTAKRERLPEFASRFAPDCRDYDYAGPLSYYFMRALARTFDTSLPSNAEEYSALCMRAGLLTEGVLSKVILRGVTLISAGAEDVGCAAYNERREPHILTLENLNAFDAAAVPGKKIYIIESLSVFSAVNDRVKDVDCALMCVENNLNAANMYLMDILTASGAELKYSGAMDYRGMQLADRIYLRYPKEFRPWRYSKSDYDKVFPSSDYYLPDSRRDMGLHSEDLASLLSYMRKKGKTSPQSALVEFLVEDIREGK